MDRTRCENALKSLTHAQKSQFNAISMGTRYIYTHVNNRRVIAGGTILQNHPLPATRSCSGCGGGAGAILLNFQGIVLDFYRVLRHTCGLSCQI